MVGRAARGSCAPLVLRIPVKEGIWAIVGRLHPGTPERMNCLYDSGFQRLSWGYFAQMGKMIYRWRRLYRLFSLWNNYLCSNFLHCALPGCQLPCVSLQVLPPASALPRYGPWCGVIEVISLYPIPPRHFYDQRQLTPKTIKKISI